MTSIIDMRVLDLRFPTSQHLDGSDAMNPDPDYSAAYVILETDTPGLEGHGLTFTIGRGNEICCAAIEALAPPGRRARPRLDRRRHGRASGATSPATASCAGSARTRARSTSPPAPSSTRSGTCWAKAEGKPVWQLVADMTPEEIVRCIDFRYITDCITPDEALAHAARHARAGKAERIADAASARAIPATPPRPAGSAIPTRSCAACAARRSTPASTTSS